MKRKHFINREVFNWLRHEFQQDPGVGFTANPLTRRTHRAIINKKEVRHEIRQLYHDLVRDYDTMKMGPPIYIIAVTNHMGLNIDRKFIDGVKLAYNKTGRSLYGGWRDEKMGMFLDAVVAIQPLNKGEALDFAIERDQRAILQIRQDGSWDEIRINS